MDFKREDFKPIYYQLASQFRRDIESGVIKAEEKLPPEEVFAAKLNVCRSTVRNAFNKLEAEGYLYRVKGKGTFAAIPKKRGRRIIVAMDRIPHGVRPLHSIVAGIVTRAQEGGAQIQFNSMDELKATLASLRNNEFFQSGVLFLHQRSHDAELLEALDRLHLPWLVQGPYHSAAHNYLDIDNKAAMTAVVDHLFELGHRRFALFTRLDNPHYKERDDATTARIAERGGQLEAHNVFAIEGDNLAEVTFDACQKLFGGPAAPTAVVCASDPLAAHTVQWLGHHGFRVPGDVSVTGFDDIPEYWNIVYPNLTTVRLDYFELGTRLSDTLLDMMADYPASRVQVEMELTLMVRESSGPAPVETCVFSK